MSDSNFGSSPKGGTVYSGPSPTGTTGTVYPGPGVPAVGTVYNGPAAGGTVYGGPSTGGTVYNGPASAAAPRPIAGTATGQISPPAVKGAKIFFIIALCTGINMVLIFFGMRIAVGLSFIVVPGASFGAIFGLNVLAACVFAVLGVFTGKGSKAAFLIGAVLYAGDMVLLCLKNPGLHPVSIVIHGVFLFFLWAAFRQLPE